MNAFARKLKVTPIEDTREYCNILGIQLRLICPPIRKSDRSIIHRARRPRRRHKWR